MKHGIVYRHKLPNSRPHLKLAPAGLNGLGSTITSNEISLSENSLLLYPNPSSGIVNIKYNMPDNSEGEIVIYDIVGNMLLKKDLKGGGKFASIDISNFHFGVYSYRYLIDKKFVHAGKLIIE